MAQIINEYPGLGALLGQGLGQGLGNSLQRVAEIKSNRLLARNQQRETARGLQSIGFSPEEASQIALLPQELQGFVLKNYLSAAENAGLAQALGGLSEQPAPEIQQQPTVAPLQRFAQQQRAPLSMQEAAQQLLGAQIPVAQQESAQQAPSRKAPEEAPRAQGLADILKRPRLTPEHRLKVEALKQQRELAQQKLSAREQEEVNKETKPVYDAIQKEAKSAKDNIKRLDRMEDLIKTGKLDSPGFASTLKTIGHGIFGFGIDLSHSLSPESQEFEKLSNDFIKNAKDYFGSRLTDADLNAFLKTIPTLSLTNDGKFRVIRNLREFAEAALLKKQASDQILKAHGGRRPRDYEQEVEELVGPQLDALAKRFKEKTPEAQSAPREAEAPAQSRSIADRIADALTGSRG